MLSTRVSTAARTTTANSEWRTLGTGQPGCDTRKGHSDASGTFSVRDDSQRQSADRQAVLTESPTAATSCDRHGGNPVSQSDDRGTGTATTTCHPAASAVKRLTLMEKEGEPIEFLSNFEFWTFWTFWIVWAGMS